MTRVHLTAENSIVSPSTCNTPFRVQVTVKPNILVVLYHVMIRLHVLQERASRNDKTNSRESDIPTTPNSSVGIKVRICIIYISLPDTGIFE